MAHPARLAILDMLARQKACVCSTLVEGLPLAQSTVSQHLAVLKKAGLIRGTIQGTSVCYCLDPAGVAEAKDRLDRLFDLMGGNRVACCPPATSTEHKPPKNPRRKP